MQEKQLGEMLVTSGIITEEQLGTVLGRIRSYGGHLASSCLHLGFADERSLARVVSTHMGVPFAVLSSCAISTKLAELLPRGTAERMGVLLLHLQGQQLSVAMTQPQNMQAIDELSFGTGFRITAYGALDGPLKQSIDAYYRHAELGADSLWSGDDVDPVRMLPPEGTLEIVRPDQQNNQSLDSSVLSPATPLTDLVDDWQDTPLNTTTYWREDDGQRAPGKRIFVVDDEPDLRNMLTDFLQQQQFIVRSAGDGREAMEILKRGLPDLIILDAMLPGVHGFDLCRMLKSSPTTKHIPVVMVSAVYRGWRYAEDIKKTYGADAFIEKPFRLDKLLKTLQSQLAGEPHQVDEPGEKAQLLVQRAVTAYRLGQTPQAIEHIQAAIKLAPFTASLQVQLARLHEHVGQMHHAIAAYERAAEVQPEEQGLAALAKLYERQGFVRKALETWERCLWVVADNERREPIRQHIKRLWEGM